MKQSNKTNPIIIYKDSANNPAISLILENETLWLTQRQIAELFGVAIILFQVLRLQVLIQIQ